MIDVLFLSVIFVCKPLAEIPTHPFHWNKDECVMISAGETDDLLIIKTPENYLMRMYAFEDEQECLEKIDTFENKPTAYKRISRILKKSGYGSASSYTASCIVHLNIKENNDNRD